MNALQTRFVLAGALLVVVTVGSGLWSAWTLSHLSRVVRETVHESQETVDLAADLAASLEREDDALLLAVSGDVAGARQNLATERQRGERDYDRLLLLLQDGTPAERALARDVRAEMDAYRTAGDELMAAARQPNALSRYHNHVNPLLRRAVTSCSRIREENFKQMEEVSLRTRDEASKAIGVVAGISLVAVLFASVVALWLARSIVLPVRALTASVEAIRQGEFGSRIPTPARDELGQLAAGFNRMAETLDEYRRSSLGELLAAKMTLEATLNALPEAVFVLGPDGALAASNAPARAVLQAKRAVGARWLPELPLLPEHQAAVTSALAGRPSNSSRTDFSKALAVLLDGVPRKFLVTAAPIPEFAPRRTGAIVVLDDITEFARLDELRSELIGVASHELKTPLTTVRMNLLLLGEKAENLTPRQHEILTAAVSGCEELGGTIDELLDVTRVEAGQLRLDLAQVDLTVVLEQVLRRLQARLEDAHIDLQILREGASAMVEGDAARLSTVLTNLLTNALKYSPARGTVTIRIWSGQNAGVGNGTPVHLAVTDRGPGIPAELRERVFEKFFRVEHHQGLPRNGVHGTGIGLYLCREIIKAHNGTIACETGEGGLGTCVHFQLPGSPP
jgi:NtrC-family two-component system sensor histidine kinase KinB